MIESDEVREIPEPVLIQALLDLGQPKKAAADLLETSLVWVIPEGAGIWDIELVNKYLTGRDRLLRHVGYAVHAVRDP